MEQRTVSEIIDDLQPILRKFEDDPGLVLSDGHEEPGSKLGDNYVALVIRTIVSGKRGDGSPYRRSIMTKVLPQKKSLLAFLNMEALFLNEAHAYNKILPMLGDFGPRSMVANAERIMMEDLREKGYGVAERRNFLDREHVTWVLKTLARFHAKSLHLKFANVESFGDLSEPLREVIFPVDCDDGVGKFMENSLTMCLNWMNSADPQTDSMKQIAEHFEQYRNKYFTSVQQLMAKPPEDYYVLCHGDTWTNNLMFKREGGNSGEGGKIIDLKLVDFQVMRYQSPALDFQYHMYTSANDEVLSEHYDDLVALYHRTFIGELKRQKTPESRWRSLDLSWFKGELKKYALFGVVSGFCLGHAHLAEEEQIKELNEMSPEQMGNLDAFTIPASPRFMERIECLATHFIRHFD